MKRLSVITILLFLTGCNSSQLRYTTLRQGQTIPDLQESQVIDNLARIAGNPTSLPYYTVISQGLANIQDVGSGGLSSLAVRHGLYPTGTLGATVSRTVQGNWTLNVMSNPDRLRAMRAAYHQALGYGPIDPTDEDRLDAIIRDQKLPGVPQRWLCVGKRREVPRGAHLVSHDNGTYVWVMPGNAKAFADFSLLILNIATYSQSSHVSGVPSMFGTVPADASPSLPPRLYEDSQSINRGLFALPR